MKDDREHLEDLAEEIVEGREVDWDEASRSEDHEDTRATIESLRTVERLRSFAKTRPEESDSPPEPEGPPVKTSPLPPSPSLWTRIRDWFRGL